MRDAERWWVTICGVVGLIGFVAGFMAVRAPAIDLPVDQAVADLVRRRARVLVGSVASVAGAGLLLWPLCVVATSTDADVWRSLALFSIASWVFGFGFFAVGSMLLVAVVWRTTDGPEAALARVLLDLSHLAIWSISAPIGALSVVATTVVGLQAGLFGPLVVVAAVAKVVTAAIEVAGVGRQRGWNAGGWAYGSSAYATVAWFALVLAPSPLPDRGGGRTSMLRTRVVTYR